MSARLWKKPWRWPRWSLLGHLTLRVIAPLALALVAMIGVSLFAYQQAVTSLVVARDQQLAELTAAQIADDLAGYARVLTTLAANEQIRSPSAGERSEALQDAALALGIFPGGVLIVDRQGRLITPTSESGSALGGSVAGQSFFRAIQEARSPAFSNVLTDARNGQLIIAIAAPIFTDDGEFQGALIGVAPLADALLTDSVAQVNIGQAGYAYLVDGAGRIIFHPIEANLGADFTDRPFVRDVLAGRRGGALWTDPSGERLIKGYAPVGTLGWGLIVREAWDEVAAPAQSYALTVVLIGLAVIAGVIYLLWRGIRRLVRPVSHLAAQTHRLASGLPVEPVTESRIAEVDTLSHDFNQMARQITSYRAGLRRYVGALTQFQEEERRRIARDLHDETIQNLLALARRLELLCAGEDDPNRLRQLAELKSLTTNVVQGLRRVSQDLRPPMLDDLGFVPALRTLVRQARQGADAVPEAALTVTGRVIPLDPAHELALYRIAQEALANVRKHARATSVLVQLTFDPAMVRLEIRDDGRGFEAPEALTDLSNEGHFGLMGIRERAWAIGGTLAIQSAPGRGTRLLVAVPYAPRPETSGEPDMRRNETGEAVNGFTPGGRS